MSMLRYFPLDIIFSNFLAESHRKRLRVCFIISGLLAALGEFSSPAIADLDKDEQALMRQMIEQYIKSNPEVIRDALMGLAAREKQASIAAGLAKMHSDDGDPVMGNKNGSLVIYEFSDYNCGYCKRMFPVIQQILNNNADIRMVIKEFPILSQSSLNAARAGIAAQKQGKFPVFHREMMTYRGQVNDESIMAAARTAGLNLEQLRQDINSPATNTIIDRTRAGAEALNINGTPALVVGNTIIPGAISLEELQNVVSRERERQS